MFGLEKALLSIIGASLFLFHLPTQAQEREYPPAEVSEVAEGLFLLQGLGCEILAVKGPDGVLIVDTGYRSRAARLQEAAVNLHPEGISKAVFTHIHWDHLGSSEALGLAGVELIAHENTRRRMMEVWESPAPPVGRFPVIQAYPEVALPSLTFSDSLILHFGGREIRLIHFPGGHSDNDVVVFFPGLDAVHTGDLFRPDGFPLIDSTHGGTIDGMIENLDALLERVGENTIVIPGHGSTSDRNGLRQFRDMLATARARIAERIEAGMTLEELLDSAPTAGLYAGGDSRMDPKLFVWQVFMDLTGQPG